MRPARAAALLAALTFAAAAPASSKAAPACRIDPARVAPWSDFEHMKQTEPPLVVEYKGCGKRLLYAAVMHANDPKGATFQAVRAAFARRPIDFVIVEGFPEAFGTSPRAMLDYSRHVAGTPEDAEPFLAIRLAVEVGAGFSGGEPTDVEVAAASGLSLTDLFGFYVLRQIEQWEREQRISGPTDPRLGHQIEAYAPIFAADTGVSAQAVSGVATLEGWSAWYRRVDGVPFAQGYRHEDAYPTGSGARPTNRMSDQVADVRDRHIVAVVARALAAHDNVLVVYGASHQVVEGPALKAAFGVPKRVALRLEPGK